MNLFKDLIANFKIDLNNQNEKQLKDEAEKEKNKQNPIIVTILGATSSITDLMKIIQRNGGVDKLPENIKKMIEELKEKNDKILGIYEVFNKFDPNFNRVYVFDNDRAYLDENEEPEWDKFKKTKFNVLKNGYSGYPYYSPKGWRRYSLKIDDFDEKYKDWPIAYHGTKSDNLINILAEGFRISTAPGNTCFGKGVYFSPSIEFCAHWRYGTPKKSKTTGFYIQTVFQCKLRPGAFSVHRETMILDEKKEKKDTDPLIDETKIIDPNFSNKELVWLISPETIDKYKKEGNAAFIIYGIMVRVTKEDPKNLPVNKWWDYFHDMKPGLY